MNRLAPLALLLLTACPPAGSEGTPGALERTGETLATVNGQPVTQGMVDQAMLAMPATLKRQLEASGQLSRVVEQVATQEALYQEALARGLQSDAEYAARQVLAERQALVELLLTRVVAERTTDEAMKTWYDEHQVQFRRPQMKVSHILVDDEAVATDTLNKLNAGGDFAAIAKEVSKDKPSAEKGGELGWITDRDVVKEFADAAGAAELNKVVGPVKTQFGYHILKVTERRDAIPFDEVKEVIQGQLEREVIQKYLEEQRAKIEGLELAPPAVPGMPGTPR